MKRFLGILVGLAVLFAVLACKKKEVVKSEGKQVERLGKITAGDQPSSSTTLPMLAVEEGYFEAEGIDAELVSFSNTADGLAAL